MQTALSLQIDARSATPIYDQISARVKYAVASGALRSGEPLPSVRQLATRLRVNPNTVARAYRELEAEGVVETRRGQGTFVAEAAPRLTPAARRRQLRAAAERLAADAMALGIDVDQSIDCVREAWSRLEAGRSRRKA